MSTGDALAHAESSRYDEPVTPPNESRPDDMAKAAPDAAPRRLVVLDRDGTLVDFVRDVEQGSVVTAFAPSQLRLLPGVVEGLGRLARAGYLLAIATNQPGAAKGEIPASAIERTNRALVARLASEGVTIAALRCCLHHPVGGEGGEPALVRACDCRKPAGGMVSGLCAELGVAPERTWLVGDSAADVGAAAAARVRSVLLVPLGRCELCPVRPALGSSPPNPTTVAASMVEAAEAILRADGGAHDDAGPR